MQAALCDHLFSDPSNFEQSLRLYWQAGGGKRSQRRSDPISGLLGHGSLWNCGSTRALRPETFLEPRVEKTRKHVSFEHRKSRHLAILAYRRITHFEAHGHFLHRDRQSLAPFPLGFYNVDASKLFVGYIWLFARGHRSGKVLGNASTAVRLVCLPVAPRSILSGLDGKGKSLFERLAMLVRG